MPAPTVPRSCSSRMTSRPDGWWLEPRRSGLSRDRGARRRGRAPRWEQRRPDLVIVDLGLPGISGAGRDPSDPTDGATPILVLSARDQERDKVAALDAGADDYLTKPFGVAELHASAARSPTAVAGPAAAGDEIRIGPLPLSTARHGSRSTARK